jgi:hypothetical protein
MSSKYNKINELTILSIFPNLMLTRPREGRNMGRTVKELKGILGKLESLAERFETAGLETQAKELDQAAEKVEGLIFDLKSL